jgi:hypothetical protein
MVSQGAAVRIRRGRLPFDMSEELTTGFERKLQKPNVLRRRGTKVVSADLTVRRSFRVPRLLVR